ncbi:MAG: glycosyl transferase family 2 [Cyanobacteria bacterium RYN_339]|nr:glycosyl transferase family 2 [Cyanobacteria bacterium RYN_339]
MASSVAPRVSLIVVNLDGREHLEAFMPTVMAQTVDAADLEVVVVDNGSTDGSAAWLRTHHPAVRIVANDRNEGFARANNQGVAVANAPFVLLVNNDMWLKPDFVAQLLAARERLGPDVACVAARILDWDGTHADFVAAGMNFEGKGFQLDHGVAADSPTGQGAEQPLLFACGGAMLVDRAVYLAAGGLDEAFFAYYEDVDFGWRLWVLGYRVMLAPEAVCHHRHNGTSVRFERHRKDVLLERNAMYAMIKNYDERALATCWPAALLLAVKRLAVRSTLDRRAWAFELATPPAPVHGLKQRVKRGLLRLGERLVQRFGPDREGAPRVAIAPEAYASAVAIEDLIDHLPALLAERRRIQAARRRPDAEIFPLFKLPFHAVEGRGRYPETQALVLEALGIHALMDGTIPCATSS